MMKRKPSTNWPLPPKKVVVSAPDFMELVRRIPGDAFDAAVKKAPISTLHKRALCAQFRELGK